MEDSVGLGLKYEDFWGERKDLKPPSKVEIVHAPGRERIPFVVKIDQKGLEKFIQEERVLGGSETRVVFEYPNVTSLAPTDLGATLLSRPPEELVTGIYNWIRSKNKSPRLGWSKNVPKRLNLAVVNVSAIYNIALI